MVLGVGIWTLVDHASMEVLLGTNLYMSAAIILVTTGVVVILISFLGCFGAVKEIKCMLLSVSGARPNLAARDGVGAVRRPLVGCEGVVTSSEANERSRNRTESPSAAVVRRAWH